MQCPIYFKCSTVRRCPFWAPFSFMLLLTECPCSGTNLRKFWFVCWILYYKFTTILIKDCLRCSNSSNKPNKYVSLAKEEFMELRILIERLSNQLKFRITNQQLKCSFYCQSERILYYSHVHSITSVALNTTYC